MRIGRRGVQVALGLLWLIDGALQLQPYMFSPRFAAQVLLPAGTGQPGWVSAVVDVFAHQIGHHPAAWNAGFAAIQLALGAGLLIPRLVRPALLASGLWAIGVWWLGEGFGGLWSGHASLITGAPGAVFLYAILAAAAWPRPGRAKGRNQPGQPVAAWFPLAWLVIWLGGALLQLLPGQSRPGDLSAEISNGDGAPGWLAHAEALAAAAASHGGVLLFVVVVTLMATVGITGSWPGLLRTISAALGAGLALVFWMVGENFGELYSGQATDPNSGPLLIVMALALLGSSPRSVAPGRPVLARELSAARAVSVSPLSYQGFALARVGTVVPVAGARAHHARPVAVPSASGSDMNRRPATGDAADLHPCAPQGQGARPRDPGRTDRSEASGRHRLLGITAALGILVTAGAAAHSATQTTPETSMTNSPPMPPGMAMPSGVQMPSGMAMPAASPAAGVPSVSARMVCSPEIRRDVAMVMGLPSPPAATASWTGHLYTCTYHLPAGRLVLSVKDGPDVPSARAYLSVLLQHLRPVSALTGMSALGLPAYQSAAGAVVFLKDDKTLEVDATGLTGPDHQARENLAYTIATDVLGCWTGK